MATKASVSQSTYESWSPSNGALHFETLPSWRKVERTLFPLIPRFYIDPVNIRLIYQEGDRNPQWGDIPIEWVDYRYSPNLNTYAYYIKFAKVLRTKKRYDANYGRKGHGGDAYGMAWSKLYERWLRKQEHDEEIVIYSWEWQHENRKLLRPDAGLVDVDDAEWSEIERVKG